MSIRHGFTLIELLVVVAIIAVLAGLLIPAVALVRARANDVKCEHDMQQVAAGIEQYRDQNDNSLPNDLLSLFDPNQGETLDRGLTTILICPDDATKGNDKWMNRPPYWEDLTYLWQQGCSWMDEVTNRPLGPNDINYFFSDLAGTSQMPTQATWAEGKFHQLYYGNPSPEGPAGFAPDNMPIVRCYYHNHWTGQNAITDDKMINISWNLSVFRSIPFWEHETNPAIPLP